MLLRGPLGAGGLSSGCLGQVLLGRSWGPWADHCCPGGCGSRRCGEFLTAMVEGFEGEGGTLVVDGGL